MSKNARMRARFPDPLGFILRGLRWLNTQWLRITYPFASMGSKVSIHPTCRLNRMNAHRIKIGSNVMMEKDAMLDLNRSSEEQGEPVIVIDDNCVINRRTQIGAKNLIHIERDVLIAQDVLIVDNNHAYEDIAAPIRDQGYTSGGRILIGEGSFIARGAAIICSRGELILGRGCFVGAYTVVTRSAPPFSVLYGNPARIVRQFDPAKQAWVVGNSHVAEH